jgi:hypothetical protein
MSYEINKEDISESAPFVCVCHKSACRGWHNVDERRTRCKFRNQEEARISLCQYKDGKITIMLATYLMEHKDEL